MEKRAQKQLIIGLIFVLIIGGIGYGLADYFFIVETTCFDKIQNGKEEGVDCGLLACGVACEPAIMPLNVQSQKLLEVRPGDYDFVAQINNPNSLFGSSRVRYALTLTRQDGTSLDKTGVFYILPGQTRYLIIPGINIGQTLSNPSLNISEIKWEKVQPFGDINFPVARKNYEIINRNGTFSELEATILNKSDFNFDKVEVGVILFSARGGPASGGSNTFGDIIAVGRTDIRTFLSRTERYFKVGWPVRLPQNIVRQDIEVLTNVFENSNFIKKYGTQERFQKYY